MNLLIANRLSFDFVLVTNLWGGRCLVGLKRSCVGKDFESKVLESIDQSG